MWARVRFLCLPVGYWTGTFSTEEYEEGVWKRGRKKSRRRRKRKRDTLLYLYVRMILFLVSPTYVVRVIVVQWEFYFNIPVHVYQRLQTNLLKGSKHVGGRQPCWGLQPPPPSRRARAPLKLFRKSKNFGASGTNFLWKICILGHFLAHLLTKSNFFCAFGTFYT